MRIFLIPTLFLFICSCASSNYVRTSHQEGFDSKKVDHYVLIELETELYKSRLLEKKKPGDRPDKDLENEFADSLIKYLNYGNIQLDLVERESDETDTRLLDRLNAIGSQINNANKEDAPFPSSKIDKNLIDSFSESNADYGIFLRIWHNDVRGYGDYGSYINRYTGITAFVIDLKEPTVVWKSSFSEMMGGSEDEIVSLIKSFIVDLRFQKEIDPSELNFKPDENMVRVSFIDDSKENTLGYISALEGFHFNFTDRLDNKSKIHVKDVSKIELMRNSRVIFSGN